MKKMKKLISVLVLSNRLLKRVLAIISVPNQLEHNTANTSLSFSPYSTVKYVVSEKATDELTTEEEDNYGLCEKDPLNTTLEDE